MKLAKRYGKKLYIYSTTSIALTPLNDAIKKDKSSKYFKYIGGIYLNNLQVKRDKNKHIRKKKCCSCSSSKHIEDKNSKSVIALHAIDFSKNQGFKNIHSKMYKYAKVTLVVVFSNRISTCINSRSCSISSSSYSSSNICNRSSVV